MMKLHRSPRTVVSLSLILLVVLLPQRCASQESSRRAELRFNVSFSAEQSDAPLDGRVLLMISSDNSKEPRQQITDDPNTAQVFGIDVERLKPGEDAVIDERVLGYPRKA